MPALEEVEESWETTETCFLDFFQKEESFKARSKNERYIRICHNLQIESRILIHTAFVVGIGVLYMNFYNTFK